MLDGEIRLRSVSLIGMGMLYGCHEDGLMGCLDAGSYLVLVVSLLICSC